MEQLQSAAVLRPSRVSAMNNTTETIIVRRNVIKSIEASISGPLLCNLNIKNQTNKTKKYRRSKKYEPVVTNIVYALSETVVTKMVHPPPPPPLKEYRIRVYFRYPDRMAKTRSSQVVGLFAMVLNILLGSCGNFMDYSLKLYRKFCVGYSFG